MRSFCSLLVLGVALLGTAAVATPASADRRSLQGKLVFVDESGGRTPAAGLEIGCAETGSSDITKAGGLFELALPDALGPADRIRLEVQRTDWRIRHPVAGQITIPATTGGKNILTVELVRAGTRSLMSEAAVEQLLFDAARNSRDQVTPEGRPAPIALARYVAEWADHYGFAPEDVDDRVQHWIAAVESKPSDSGRLALAAFARSDLDRASSLALNLGRHASGPDAVRAYRLAADARYADHRFEDALRLYRKALGALGTRRSSATWAAIQDDIGRAARELGIRTEGRPAQRYLDESIAAHRAALQVLGQGLAPRWAESQTRLALALRERASRTSGEAGVALLAQSVRAYRAALQLYTRERTPQEWARIQNDLAAALQEQGNGTRSEAGPALLAQAADAYRAALEVYTRESAPRQWATVQHRLGIALQDQANRSPGEPGRALLAQAAEAYRAALEVFTRGHAPQRFASIQNDLGTALEDQASRSPGEAGQALMAQAAQAYSAATEIDTNANPFNLQHFQSTGH